MIEEEAPAEEVIEEEAPAEEVIEEEAPAEEVAENDLDSLDSISEDAMGKALGMEEEKLAEEDSSSIPDIAPIPVPLTTDDAKAEESEPVKKEVSGDIETIMALLQQLDSVGLKKVLDGMELNISISFKDKSSDET